VVLLLYRPVHKDNGGFTGEDGIVVGKAREGPGDVMVPVWYDDRKLQFKPRFMRGL
jgi:hypothetical protein